MVSPETVTQRIKLLRSVLEDDSQNPRYIVGVRGRGYKLISDVQALYEEQAIGQTAGMGQSEQPENAKPSLQRRPIATLYRQPRYWLPAALLFILVALALLTWWPPQNNNISIAVIPLANLSPDSEQDYFADGLSEELINKLSRVQGLDVTGRISSFYFKERGSTLNEIDELLDVNYVLQGGVRKSGEQLRITVQLMDTRTGTNQWTETYDRELNDLLLVQDEIASAVTKTLSLTIGAGEFSRPGATRNMEAFDAYLRARAQIIVDQEDMQTALDYLDQALNLDPGFALASALRARIYFSGMPFLSAEERAESIMRYAEVKEQVRQAAPGLPELQLIEYGEFMMQRDYVEAERKLQDYLGNVENTAASAEGSRAYGLMLVMMGRVQAALPLLQNARSIEPLDIQVPILLSSAFLDAGRFDDARAEVQRGLRLDPGNPSLSALAIMLPLANGNDRDMADLVNQGDEAGLTARWTSQESSTALSEVRALVESKSTLQLSDLWLAKWAAALGDHQLALHVLRQIRDPAVLWSTIFSETRKLPGFKELVGELALPAYWRTTGNWADRCRPLGEDFECF